MRLLAILVVVAGTSAMLEVPEAPAATLIATEPRPPSHTALAAHNGRVVWSHYSATARKWVLMTRFEGATSRVPIAGRRSAFDADLGPDRTNATVAVYSRCRRGGRCQLYRFDFARRRESRLGIGSRHTSEVSPTIWGSRIAFVRVFPRRRGVAGQLRHIYVQSLSSRARPRQVSGGTRGEYDASCERRPCERNTVYEGGVGPLTLELRRGRLAFTWEFRPARCPGEDPPPDLVRRQELWTVIIGRDARRVRRGRCDQSIHGAIASPSLSVTGLYFRDYATLGRFDLRTGELTRARLTRPGSLYWVVRDGSAIYYAATSGSDVEIYQATDSDFEPLPPGASPEPPPPAPSREP